MPLITKPQEQSHANASSTHGHFPARPQELERDILDEAYSELRHAYRGLMVSRGLFRSKADQNRTAMLELEARLRSIAERKPQSVRRPTSCLKSSPTWWANWKMPAMSW